MKRKLSGSYPLWVSLIIYWLLTFALLGAALAKTNGHFSYPLDDTYIHMAIGKHFITDGSWSVSQNSFNSSTSSPLWTFLIAVAYKVFGVNDWIPFFLCLLAGSFLVYYIYRLLRKIRNSVRLVTFLLFIILFTPLPILTLIGMEHVLHSLFTMWLLYSAVTLLTRSALDYRQVTLTLLLAGFVTITRYEGLFLVFSIMLLFLAKKRYWMAFLIAGAGLLPVTVYGIFSVAQGWYFLPNSVLLKGNVPALTMESLAGFLQQLPTNLVNAPHVLTLMIFCLIIYLWGEKQKVFGEKERYLIAIFTLMTLLHMQFASIGWFYRYEAYIVLTGSVILVDISNGLISEHPVKVKVGEMMNYAVVISLGILLVIPLAVRAGSAFHEYPIAVTNIYEQQYQMGLFLKKFYPGKAVAANDIGAINYLTNIKTLDLFGLGSMEVAQARRNGLYNRNVVDNLVSRNGVEIVIIYKSWFIDKIPSQWVEIGTWQIFNNVICGSDEISFYAPRASLQENVTANLREFSNLLPSTIRQSGIYIHP